MAVIQKELIVAAGDVVDNVVSGSSFEFLRQNSVVSIGCTGDTGSPLANIQLGADIVLEESPIAVTSDFPRIPDEMYYNEVGLQGDRLVIRLRNAGAGNVTFRVLVQLTPVR